MLKDVFENDKRGLPGLPHFVKQVADDLAIIDYCGQGFSHTGLFKFQKENGWIFIEYIEHGTGM
jgi:hypothetical protein